MKKVYCTICGTANPIENRFCSVCAYKLMTKLEDPDDTIEICPSCGQANPLENRFCFSCGYSFRGERASESSEELTFTKADLSLEKREKLERYRRLNAFVRPYQILFAGSSLFLFASYEYIPSGLATTLVYLYPVFVALIMVFLRFYPSWRTWLSIVATFGGILLLSAPSSGAEIRLPGIILAVLSALSYAFYLVIVDRSGRIKHVSEHTLTLYALVTGTFLFAAIRCCQGGSITEGIDTAADWGNLLGLAVVPTMISMLTLAVSSRFIGPTKTSVLGVFEPLTAILIGTFIFGEPMTWKMGVGVVICVGAVVFMILKPGPSQCEEK